MTGAAEESGSGMATIMRLILRLASPRAGAAGSGARRRWSSARARPGRPRRPRRGDRGGAADRRGSRAAGGSRRRRPLASSSSTSTSPASGPSAIATATARLSSTTGDGDDARQLAVQQRDLAPVGRRRRRVAVAWHAAIAACTWYGPGRDRAATRASRHRESLRGSRRGPSACGPAPRAARGRRASSTRAARRESCRSISASRPSASGSSGISCDERAREADGFVAQDRAHEVGAGGRRVALVEQQVEHGEHRARALGQQVRRRDAVRDAGVADLVLGPHEPLRHRRLGHEERACDLGGREPGERAQRQRDLRLDRQRRVAAREDQPQAVVLDAAVVGIGRKVREATAPRPPAAWRHRSLARRSRSTRAVAGRRGEPRAGIARDAVARPTSRAPARRRPARIPRRGPSRRSPRISVATTRPHSSRNAVATAASTSALTSPRSAAPRSSRRARPGSSTRPRSPRRGPCSRRCRSRRSAPWSRRRGRRR